jgi:hypothetical protein
MLLLAAAILVVAITVYFTLAVRPEDLPAAEPVSPTRHLEQRKAAIYENLRDLQFEYRVGKLSDADYQQTKLVLQKELATVLGHIEEIMTGTTASGGGTEVPRVLKPAPRAQAPKCPHCGAQFPKPMKFCGECGKAMAS